MSATPEQPTPLGEVFATRRYYRPVEEGGEYLAEVAIGRPVPAPGDPNEFVCPFRITIKEQEIIRIARGVDEMHALLMALAFVDGALNVLKQSLGGRLMYLGGEVGDLGLQIPDLAKLADEARNSGQE